jgi:UDP-N-acetylmuramoyl-L-alanyl-D-glutamate--2,6-diaminopimelate ligase
MLLSELLSAIEPLEVLGRTDKEIKGLHFDSRQIGEGYLFVAQVGTAVDGHTFISSCVEKGAAAIVLSKREYMAEKTQMDKAPCPKDTTYILVENTDKALGLLASKWF